MAAEGITERVVDVVARTARLPAGRVTADSSFADLGLDSFDAINIAFALEEEFQVAIPDDLLRSVTGVPQAVDGLRTLLAQAASPPAAS